MTRRDEIERDLAIAQNGRQEKWPPVAVYDLEDGDAEHIEHQSPAHVIRSAQWALEAYYLAVRLAEGNDCECCDDDQTVCDPCVARRLLEPIGGDDATD